MNAIFTFTNADFTSTSLDMDPRRLLYTRQQLGEIAGIDDTTLNYWSRENVLRPVEGGAGRGSHRRFAYYEVTLAAIFGELRNFGIGVAALRQLADRFHEAIDWLHARGITRDTYERIDMLQTTRRQIVERGSYRIYADSARDYSKYEAMGLTPEPDADHPHMHYYHLSWEQAVADLRSYRPEGHYPDELVRFVEELPHEEYQEHMTYYMVATHINDRKPDEEVSTEPDYFYRNPDGSWVLSPDKSEAGRAVSFIGVDIERLSYRIWYGK